MVSDNRLIVLFLRWLGSFASRVLQAYARGCMVFLNGSSYDNSQS